MNRILGMGIAMLLLSVAAWADDYVGDSQKIIELQKNPKFTCQRWDDGTNVLFIFEERYVKARLSASRGRQEEFLGLKRIYALNDRILARITRDRLYDLKRAQYYYGYTRQSLMKNVCTVRDNCRRKDEAEARQRREEWYTRCHWCGYTRVRVTIAMGYYRITCLNRKCDRQWTVDYAWRPVEIIRH